MVKAELYNKNKTYIANNGAIADFNYVQSQFPSVDVFPFVALTDETRVCLLALDPLVRRRGQLGVDPALSDEDAVGEIERLENERMRAESEVYIAPEERIAAALEFQNIMMLPDIL